MFCGCSMLNGVNAGTGAGIRLRFGVPELLTLPEPQLHSAADCVQETFASSLLLNSRANSTFPTRAIEVNKKVCCINEEMNDSNDADAHPQAQVPANVAHN